jgi:neuronal growth regulator 1
VSLNNMVTADVELKVKMPPVISEDVALVKRVVAGESADLVCEAAGFPSPKITWKKKDGTLLPTGKETHTATKLVISKARREDRGNSCIARKSRGRWLGKSFGIISLQIWKYLVSW